MRDVTPGSLHLCITASAQSTTQRLEAEGRKWSGEGRRSGLSDPRGPLSATWTSPPQGCRLPEPL